MIKTIKYFIENSPEEINNDLIASWNEINEALTSLEQLTEEEIRECWECIIQRLENAQNLLGKYVSDEEVLEENI
jgi:hypothetical protein